MVRMALWSVREVLCAAIGARRVVRVRREADPEGAVRVGEPHLVFRSRAGNELVALFQTGGYSRSGTVPEWRNIDLDDIVAVALTSELFEQRADFDRESTQYFRPVC